MPSPSTHKVLPCIHLQCSNYSVPGDLGIKRCISLLHRSKFQPWGNTLRPHSTSDTDRAAEAGNPGSCSYSKSGRAHGVLDGLGNVVKTSCGRGASRCWAHSGFPNIVLAFPAYQVSIAPFSLFLPLFFVSSFVLVFTAASIYCQKAGRPCRFCIYSRNAANWNLPLCRFVQALWNAVLNCFGCCHCLPPPFHNSQHLGVNPATLPTCGVKPWLLQSECGGMSRLHPLQGICKVAPGLMWGKLR